MYNAKTIYEVVKEMEDEDQHGSTKISEYVTFDMRKTLETIDAYINSKHISGETDSLGREKPFFNIVTAAVNIWYRATDIDRKDCRIRATEASHYLLAFLATIHVQQWMRDERFGVFLNEWGRTKARYGSAVLKFVEKGPKLHCEVVPWNRMICDPIDFENNVKVEKLWLTPSQLRKNKSYDKDVVKELLDRPTKRETLDGQAKDMKDDYIPIYEVHGEMPLSFLTGEDEDEDEYVQQMHVISCYGKGSGEGMDGKDGFTLYKGRESKDPYMITHLIKEDGRTLSIGAVEHLFEAQWMTNHSIKQMKDQIDLASKLLFQTADGNFVGQNALTNLENGDILIHAPNMALTPITNQVNIGGIQAFQGMWQSQGNTINGLSDAMLGVQPPSGTAWRQTEALLQESRSLFEQMKENGGLDVEEMFRVHIIPHIKKKMDTTEEISATLDARQIEKIDAMYLPNEVIRRINQKKKDTILSGEVYDPMQEPLDLAMAAQQIQDDLKGMGNQRFIRPADIEDVTWKEALEGLEWELEVDVTGEAEDTQATMATLNTLFQTLVSNPMALQDPNVKMVFARILESAGGISPIEIQDAAQPMQQQMAPPTQPQMAQQMQPA